MHILLANIECCKFPFSFDFHRDEVKNAILAIQNPIRQRQTYLGDMMILKSYRNRIQYIDYTYNEYGKPSLKYASHLYFSKSHSHDYVITVTADYNIGVDIEKYSAKMQGMKHRYLNEFENELLESAKEPEKFLCEVWVIKESFSKLLGVGLLLDFRKIHIDFQKGVIKYDSRKQAHFLLRTLFDEYMVAICTLKEIKEPLNIKHFSLQD